MKRILRIILKTILILAIISSLYFILQPEPTLGKFSLYNSVFPGRQRLPFGESPQTAYNFSLYNLNAMFASHEISGAEKSAEEFRVLVIGDSSVWGTLLKPEETLAGQLDNRQIEINGQMKTLEVFNLGYPTLSLAKDVLLLNRGLAYQPDLILWMTTLESFPVSKQTASPLLDANLKEFNALMDQTDTELSWQKETETPTWQQKTLTSQRRALMDLFRLQMYGFMWAATGIDQDYPEDFPPAQIDLDPDNTFQGVEGIFPKNQLAWELLETGIELAGDVPVLLVNEPILISDGQNSEFRYNFYYPRETYDAWRADLNQRCERAGWDCMDLWDLLPVSDFTNSAIHYNSSGGQKIALEILKTLPDIK